LDYEVGNRYQDQETCAVKDTGSRTAEPKCGARVSATWRSDVWQQEGRDCGRKVDLTAPSIVTEEYIALPLALKDRVIRGVFRVSMTNMQPEALIDWVSRFVMGVGRVSREKDSGLTSTLAVSV
jgi:hypothetical protein